MKKQYKTSVVYPIGLLILADIRKCSPDNCAINPFDPEKSKDESGGSIPRYSKIKEII